MIEYFVPGFIYSVAKDIWASFRPGRHKLDQTEILKRRMKWKGEFESRVSERYQKSLEGTLLFAM